MFLCLVSIPYRHSKNATAQSIFHHYQSVSIPYRHSKNSFEWICPFLSGTVSIPYRHSKNPETVHEISRQWDLFQFLIGTLKTRTRTLSSSISCWFQFLIGTLKTWGLFFWWFYYFKAVSIPYRHSKNFALKSIWNLWVLLFQFLIGTLKTCDSVINVIFYTIFVSIPYRHSKNVLKSWNSYSFTSCFNSL